MAMTFEALMLNPRFPRASGYDPRWVADNQMGPNALWLLEWLCEALALRPGMRVLDLGCGRALTSVYLAKEHGATVFATDLWIPATDNLGRAEAAGCADRVFPIHAEAHALPFAEGFFDAVVSVDAWPYFGTDDLYLSYISRFLKPGGMLGVVAPGLVAELDGPPPAHLTEPQANGATFWEPDCATFHSAPWWRRHWERTGLVTVEVADVLEDGWRHWARHEHAMEDAGASPFPSVAESLERDAGATLCFVRLVAQSRAEAPAGPRTAAPHVWEPAFMGVVAGLLGGEAEAE